MYAVIQTGGKQVRVSEGQEFYIEKIDADVDQVVEFTEILMIGGEKVSIGSPTVAGAKVVAKVLKQGRGSKIIVFKYKRRKDYRKKQGHRQAYTKLVVEKIVG